MEFIDIGKYCVSNKIGLINKNNIVRVSVVNGKRIYKLGNRKYAHPLYNRLLRKLSPWKQLFQTGSYTEWEYPHVKIVVDENNVHTDYRIHTDSNERAEWLYEKMKDELYKIDTDLSEVFGLTEQKVS